MRTTLRTTGAPAYGQNNGLHVVLQPDGSVTSWVEGKKAAAKKAVTPVRVVHLPDGRVTALRRSPPPSTTLDLQDRGGSGRVYGFQGRLIERYAVHR